MKGTLHHQLYSQITWRFYDVFLGIVMTFDAKDPAGHVHCMLSWSDGTANNWQWVDAEGGLAALKEFIPAGAADAFDSHICFAAHVPLRMPDGTSRVYYMGGNGPHSGARNSSFALATMEPDRFAGVSGGSGDGVVSGRAVNVTGPRMIVTLDVAPGGGSVSVGIVGGPTDLARSLPITASGTDVTVAFPGGATLDAVMGDSFAIKVWLDGDATTLYTVGFAAE